MITSVKMRNFNLYQQAKVNFAPGLNVIAGASGSGKTTIIEALLFGLFGYLPSRNKGHFLRPGTKTGQVEVAFTSTQGGRAVVTRALHNSITDFNWNGECVNGLAKIEQAIRLHLGLPVGTNLPYYAETACYIAQGELTSSFLMPPHRRRDVFNELTGISAYQQALSLLRSQNNGLEANQKALEAKAEVLSRSTGAQRETLAKEISQLGDSIALHELSLVQFRTSPDAFLSLPARDSINPVCPVCGSKLSARKAWEVHRQQEIERQEKALTGFVDENRRQLTSLEKRLGALARVNEAEVSQLQIQAANIYEERKKLAAVIGVIEKAVPLITEYKLARIQGIATRTFSRLMSVHHELAELYILPDYGLEASIDGSPHISFKPNLSGGEQGLAAISVWLALSAVQEAPLFILDEPTVNLDAPQIGQLVEVLSGLKGHYDQLIVISHDDSLADLADHVIRVRKNKENLSEVELAEI